MVKVTDTAMEKFYVINDTGTKVELLLDHNVAENVSDNEIISDEIAMNINFSNYINWTNVTPIVPRMYGNIVSFESLMSQCTFSNSCDAYNSDQNFCEENIEKYDCTNLTKNSIVNFLETQNVPVYNYHWLTSGFATGFDDSASIYGPTFLTSLDSMDFYAQTLTEVTSFHIEPILYYDKLTTNNIRPSIILNKSQIS